MYSVDKIRNLAIVAHIDHGKTTLIDSIFRGAHTFRENAQIAERVMDSGELERERGITITSKHCTVEWNGYLINIIDTPGTRTSPVKSNAFCRWSTAFSFWSTPTKAPCPRRVTSFPERWPWG